jgi:eukaryotic-like serine/threonine-protein kinase
MKTSWQKVKEIFDAALEREPPQRAKFLDEICGGDDDLRREVESLLASFAEADSFLETPAVAAEPDLNETERLQTSIGAKLAHYEIVRQIGAGGMGEVYLAKDKKLDRRVAIKILNGKFNQQQSNVERFIKEAKAASALNHPNILVIHEIGESGAAKFIVSEYVEGKTLREILNGKTLTLAETLDIAVQIASALSAAHSSKIVHRDIKPENVVVRPDGLVKILDFGLAKLVEDKTKSLVDLEQSTARQNETSKGVILGTVNYMSPEQARGQKVDERTDIFSFGVLLYEMITGRTPFAAASVSETFANLINKEPPPLARFAENVPPELQRIVAKTLRKNRDERHQTMKGVAGDLKDLRHALAIEKHLEKSHSPDQTTAIFPGVAAGGAAGKTFVDRIKSHRAMVLFAAVLLASIGFGYWFFLNRAADRRQISSIAVLPFENGSGNADLDYLSDGVSDSVIDRLTQLTQLKVIARTSSFRYRGANLDLPQIAAALGVDAIVTGRVIQRGDSYQIRVDVTDMRENKQLWGENFNRKTSDVQFLQTDISREIAENLRLRLSGAQTNQLAKSGTNNPQAYELLLKGRFFFNKATRENWDKAVEYYEQATNLDPNYALAYAELAEGYNLNGGRGLTLEQKAVKQETAARRALELDANLAEAHYAVAEAKRRRWQWQAAESEYLRAIELNPNLPQTYRGYSIYLSFIGRHDEAVANAKRAGELDPLSIPIMVNIVRQLYLARRYDEGIAAWQKSYELDTTNPAPHYCSAASMGRSECIGKPSSNLRKQSKNAEVPLPSAKLSLANFLRRWANVPKLKKFSNG